MNYITPALVILLFIGLSMEGSQYLVYGKFISERKLDLFLNVNLDKYHINPYSKGNSLTGSNFENMNLPYIAKSNGILSKYYIEDSGRIWRWSQWTKILDQQIERLKKTSVPAKIGIDAVL